MSHELCILILFCIAVHTHASRILAVFPIPSVSHQIVIRPLTQELARRGHEVVVITTDPVFLGQKSLENLTEIDLHDLSYTTWNEQFYAMRYEGVDSWLKLIESCQNIILNIFEDQLGAADIQELLSFKHDHFDLLLIEHMFKPAFVFSHVFKAPVIQISSFGSFDNNFNAFGATDHPFLYPKVTRQKIYNLTNWEKISALYKDYSYNNIWVSLEVRANEMLRRKLDPNIPSLSELSKNVDMLFLNVNPLWEGNRPVPQNVIYLGGLHQQPETELPMDLKAYLDSSKNGVIYMSFGTNIKPSLLPSEFIEIFTRVFSRIPYDVLWKWDTDEFPSQSGNIKIFKWLPQADLLKHKNVRLFITQCGLQSTDEAISAGVPLVGFPFFFDQWYNADKYVYHKIGIKLSLETMTEEILYNGIKTVIEDESYRRNIQRLRDLMQDQPQTSLERAVWWTEYVIRHGGAKHLRGPAAFMSWAEFLELELVCTLLIVFFIICAALYAFAKVLWYFSSKFLTCKLKIKLS